MSRTHGGSPSGPAQPLRSSVAALATLVGLAIAILAAFFVVVLVLAATGSTSPVMGSVLTLVLVTPAAAGAAALLARVIVPKLAGAPGSAADPGRSRNLVLVTLSVATAALVLLSSGEGPVGMALWIVTVGGGGALGAWAATRRRPSAHPRHAR